MKRLVRKCGDAEWLSPKGMSQGHGRKSVVRGLLHFILVVIVFAGGHVSPTAAQDLLFEGDFETGDLTGFYWHQNKPEVVTTPHPVRAGNYSMRSYLHHYNQPYHYRTEVHIGSDDDNPPGTHEVLQFDIGGEYWIGFSVYIPSDFEPDNLGELVFQFHGDPDTDDSGNYIENWRNPILAWYISGDKWNVHLKWDSKRITPPHGTPNRYDGATSLYGEPLEIGKWTDWVVHVKWNYEENGDGFLKIWKDGSLIIDRTGPNCFNDQRGPYMAMGVYKWDWASTTPSNTDSRLYYHDELKIGGADARYEGVAPGGGSPPASPDSVHCFPLGDIDCSSRVNGIDFGYLVSHWGTSDPQANFDDSGVVDSADVLILLGNYGKLNNI